MAVKHFPMVHTRAAIALAPFGHPHARLPLRRAPRVDPRLFGRARPRFVERRRERRWSAADDLWLFGSTFAAGFLFITILLA
jgi:hypothetical protein